MTKFFIFRFKQIFLRFFNKFHIFPLISIENLNKTSLCLHHHNQLQHQFHQRIPGRKLKKHLQGAKKQSKEQHHHHHFLNFLGILLKIAEIKTNFNRKMSSLGINLNLKEAFFKMFSLITDELFSKRKLKVKTDNKKQMIQVKWKLLNLGMRSTKKRKGRVKQFLCGFNSPGRFCTLGSNSKTFKSHLRNSNGECFANFVSHTIMIRMITISF